MESDKLKKRSRQGALISAFGFVIILATFGYASWKLNSLNSEIVEKTEEHQELVKSIGTRKIEKSDLENMNDSLRTESQNLQQLLSSRNNQVEQLSNSVSQLGLQADQFKQQLTVQRQLVTNLNSQIAEKTTSINDLKEKAEAAQSRLESKQKEIAEIERRLAQLKAEKERIELNNKELSSEKEALNSFLEKSYGDKETKITPKATSVKDGQYYDFTIWLEMTDAELRKIQKVTYYYNHPSFKRPKVEVTNMAGGFRTEYKGWGCLENMPITITYRGGKEENIIFRMCEYINNSSIPTKGGERIPVKGKGN